jgi:serine/threonine protein kinase
MVWLSYIFLSFPLILYSAAASLLFYPKFAEVILSFFNHVAEWHWNYTNLYFYRDIKGANLLVDINGVVKLADFGTTVGVSWTTWPACGYHTVIFVWRVTKLSSSQYPYGFGLLQICQQSCHYNINSYNSVPNHLKSTPWG